MAPTRPAWLPVAVDVALGVVLALIAIANANGDFPGQIVPAVLMACAGLAQVLRRRQPMAAYLVSFGLMILAAVLVGHFESGGSLVIGLAATYAAVVYGVPTRIVLLVTSAFVIVLNVPGQRVEDAIGDSLFTVVVLAMAAWAGYAVRRIRELSKAAAIALAAEAEAERLLASETAAAEERNRIQRELHDILAHSLGIVVLQSGAAAQALDYQDQARARDALNAARSTAMAAMSEVRAMLRVIEQAEGAAEAPGVLTLPPALADLDALVARVRAAGFDAQLHVEGIPIPVPSAVQTSLFRVAQEGITNAMKHSGARGCALSLRYLGDHVEVEVVDDGDGTAGRGPGARAGLVGIAERAQAFGGTVDSGPRSQGGWSVRVAIPVST